MMLSERHVIKPNNKLFPFLDDLCFKAKNLYNATLYRIRQEYFNTKQYLSYYSVQKEFQNNNNPDYRALPVNVSQQIMRVVDQNYKSFFAALKVYSKCKTGQEKEEFCRRAYNADCGIIQDACRAFL